MNRKWWYALRHRVTGKFMVDDFDCGSEIPFIFPSEFYAIIERDSIWRDDGNKFEIVKLPLHLGISPRK